MAPRNCDAHFCYNYFRSGQGLSFFRFPKDREIANEWARNSNRRDLEDSEQDLNKTKRFCADHFEDCMFMNEKRNQLIKTAVPHLFIFEEEIIRKIHQLDLFFQNKKKEAKGGKRVASKEEEKEEGKWMELVDAASKDCSLTSYVGQVRKDVRMFIEEMGMVPRRRRNETLGLAEKERIKNRMKEKHDSPVAKRRKEATLSFKKELFTNGRSVLEEDFQSPRASSKDIDKATFSDATVLYDPSIIDRLQFSAYTCFRPPIESPRGVGPGFYIRPLALHDFDKGFSDLLETIANMGKMTKAEFVERFLEMKRCHGTYYVTVIEDLQAQRIVGAGTLLLERKFIRKCALKACLEDVAVSALYKGKQFGKILVVTLVELAKSLGCYKLTIDCSDKLAGFYSALGFGAEEGNSTFLTMKLS